MTPEKHKVLISNEELYAKCSKLFITHNYVAELMPKSYDEIMAAIKEQHYDVMLIDASVAKYNAIKVMKHVRENSGEKLPLIMAVTFPSEAAMRELCSNGADYIFVRPVEIDIIINRVISFVEAAANIGNEPIEPVNFAEMVTEILHNIGMPSHLRGFNCFRDAIIMALKEPDILGGITKELYPSVAKKNSTSPSSVERTMRNAIKVTWGRGDSKVLGSYFGYSKNSRRITPTNSEFVTTIVDKIKLNYPKGIEIR
ncbi:MAG: sporulation transcription factor Spo0A [Oscillospiraceae bacterium]|nr:sporulation transcription factor Spo0A [Oscillospiraceae bacterium]